MRFVEAAPGVVGREQDGVSAGQGLRPALRGFAVGEFRRLRRNAAAGRYTEERSTRDGEEDRTILRPCATTIVSGGNIAQRYHDAAGHSDFLQLQIREERDRLAIRRKERTSRASGPRDQGRLQLTEPAQVQLRRPAGAGGRDER